MSQLVEVARNYEVGVVYWVWPTRTWYVLDTSSGSYVIWPWRNEPPPKFKATDRSDPRESGKLVRVPGGMWQLRYQLRSTRYAHGSRISVFHSRYPIDADAFLTEEEIKDMWREPGAPGAS